MNPIQHESRLLECEYVDPTEVIHEQSIYKEVVDIKCFDDLRDIDINEFYCRLGDKIIFFNEMYDEQVYNEASGGLNNKYKRLLYNDRIRNNKAIISVYEKVKEDNKWIKRTYLRYDRYK